MLNEDELRGAPVLIFANKQDLPNAMSVDTVIEKLRLHSLDGQRPWHCQGSVGPSGDGIWEGMNWISGILDPKMAAEQKKKQMAYQSLQLVAPCVAFVHHNRSSKIVDSIFHLLPTIMGFLGSKLYEEAPLETSSKLQHLCATQYFNALTGRKDVVPPLIKHAVPTSKTGIAALQPLLDALPLANDQVFQGAVADEAMMTTSDDALFASVAEVCPPFPPFF